MQTKTIAGQNSWIIRSRDVELAITQLGGHMAPVTFYRRDAKSVQPYHITPWQGENLPLDVPVLVPLRGDFFCMPFGDPSHYGGKDFPGHGETATRHWRLVDQRQSDGGARLVLEMKTRVLSGTVRKELTLVDGQNVVYSRHVLEGFSGKMTLAHHATLAMPPRQRSVHLATSPMRLLLTHPVPPDQAANGMYYCLAPGRTFKSLSRVPLVWQEPAYADLRDFPNCEGFCNHLAMYNKPVPIAWSTAVFEDEGFCWFSLKDPAVLPSTMLWSENHGRHCSPWNGRNSCLGIEEVCALLSMGLAPSARANVVSRAGIPTTCTLSPRQPSCVNYIQGVVKVPRGFKRVKAVQFGPGEVVFTSDSGKKVAAPVAHEFIKTGKV